MPAAKYNIGNGDLHEIEISWSGFWKNARVTHNGQEIGSFADQKDLRSGKVFVLPDGRNLSVQLVQRFTWIELHVLCDGKPVRGSASDPNQRLKVAYRLVFFVAALSTIAGVLASLFRVGFLVNMGVNYESIIAGAVLFVLGWFVKRRSMVALGLAVFLFALDGILSALHARVNGHGPPTGALIARIFMLIPMIQGFGAIRALKADASVVKRVAKRQDSPVKSGRRGLQERGKEPQRLNPTLPAGRWIVAVIIAVGVIYLAIVILRPAGSAR